MKQRIKINTKDEHCTCMCHRKGVTVRHIKPCCDLTYETFLDENGDLMEDKYNELLDKKK